MKIIAAVLMFCSVLAAQTSTVAPKAHEPQAQKPVKTGADLLFEKHYNLIEGKRVGLVTNHSAMLSNGMHLADALMRDPKVKLVALFGPEHGIRGDAPDGKSIQGGVDPKTGVPVYSLYGKINKPTDEMLKNVDVLIYDIQDVGVRFYTFTSTMMLAMEAAAEHHIPYIVLDRPNPIRGVDVEGPIRDDSLKSFVGWAPVPIAYGMTIGELATMANNEGWLANGVKANLTVVKMENWKRSDWYDETGLTWIKPSPNMPTLQTAIVYPGMCLIEGTNVSEGRGTKKPFEYFGAPWINSQQLMQELNGEKLPGVEFVPIQFTPRDIPHVTSNPKYNDERCFGIFVHVTNRDAFLPVKTGIAVVAALHKLFPDNFKFSNHRFDLLSGTSRVRQMILEGKTADEIVASWQAERKKFEEGRTKYLLY
jgi:uncharacterized protein YbbC (DUF1343 family)